MLQLLIVLTGLWQNPTPPASQPPVRVAIVEASWGETEFDRTLLQTLTRRIAEIDGVTLLDPDLVQSAVKGFGYDGSLNLTRREAQDIGAAIGCDYYILGRGRIAPLSIATDQMAHRAWAALFFVETRSGRLASFRFLKHVRDHAEESVKDLLGELQSTIPTFADELRQSSPPPHHAVSSQEIIRIDDPTAIADGLTPPEILISPKPEYTTPAHIADVIATVELSVTFLPDGTIGPIEVVRWAGFGLDESAIETAQRIKFRPARQNDQLVAVRALVQYKFKFTPPLVVPSQRPNN